MSGARLCRRCGLMLVAAGVLFGCGAVADAASPGDGAAMLDRMTYAVDGVESSHGADPRMWRAEPAGPQGPMQVSAGAAADTGGGNRFDDSENRTLGRAYLARLYGRYGDWPDALAAYNWGPGNMDAWIAAGRQVDKLPPAVMRYRIRVLSAALDRKGLGPGLGIVHRQPRRSIADLRHPGKASLAVERLYRTILRASADAGG